MSDDKNNINQNPDGKKPISFRVKALTAFFCVVILAAAAFAAVGFFNAEENAGEAANSEAPAKKAAVTKAAALEEIGVAPSAIGDITITPTASSELGVDVNSTFLIKTKDNLTKEQLLSFLSVKSGEGFDLEEGQDGYVLSFEKPLDHDQVYNFQYNGEEKAPLSFAFQTESVFGVTATTPANNGYGVPAASGIEVSFNQELAVSLEKHFKISPNVAGRFDRVGNTHIFIPEKLQNDTSYTVTIQAGLKSANGEVLEKDHVFTFRTEWASGSVEDISVKGGLYETFLPDDDVLIELYVDNSFKDSSYTVDIYEIKTPESYISFGSSSGGNSSAISPPKDAALLESIETKLFVIDNGEKYNSYYYIMLHKPLPEGYYFLDIKTSYNGIDHSLAKLIQVSALSVYSVSLNGETCIWVHDTTTGEPAAGAAVNIDGVTGETGTDGTAIIQTTANGSSIVRVSYGDYPANIYMNKTYDPKTLTLNDKYYSYLYTDRKVYLPEDKIDIFGVIRERYSEFKLKTGDKVTLKLGDMLEMPLTLDKYGSFNVSIPISGMYSHIDVSVYVNGDKLTESEIYFADYSKDKYILTAQSDRTVYFEEEAAAVELSVTTFDGLPMEGVKLTNNRSNNFYITDENGLAIANESIQASQWRNGWTPYHSNMYFYISDLEEMSQSVYLPIFVIPSDIMLEHEILSDNAIDFSASHLDRDALEEYFRSESEVMLEPDIYRGSPADISFTVDIYKHTTERIKTGERYDFIKKINVSEYTYKSSEELFHTYNAHTINGKTRLTDLPVSSNPLVSYYAVVNYQDKRGIQQKIEIYYGHEAIGYEEQSTNKEYNFKLITGRDNDPYAYLNRLGLNETGTIRLTYRGAAEEELITEGRILTVTAGNEIISTAVGSPADLPFKFTEPCISSVEVFGAYFDGKYIFPIQYPMTISYDYNERELDFDISFDKEAYRPGDEVNAKIKVTDKDGRPVKALVNVSVVDEAVFGEQGHNAYFLNDYYGSIWSYNYQYYVYASYTQHDFMSEFGSGAEKGGGGDNAEYRKDFQDNPAFVSVETDNNGGAELTCKLSDSITSWRFTVHGITGDNYAGSTKANVISTLPYYIDLVMLNEFVAGDEVSILVKSHGENYKLNETEASYTVDILKDEKPVYSETKPSHSYASFNAGALEAGDYVVRVIGSAGEYKDAIEEKVSVVKNGMWLPLNSTQSITENSPALSRLNVTHSPVTVTLSNGDMSTFMKILRSCIDYGSKRTDAQAAAAYEDYFFTSGAEALRSNTGNMYGLYSYGVPELTYGESDLFYTARFAAAFHELISKKDIRRYIADNAEMYVWTNDSSNGLVTAESSDSEKELKRAAGYFCLAAINENVLLEIYDQLDIIAASSDQKKFVNDYNSHMRVLYYTAALCAIGDDSRAQEFLNKYPAASNILADVEDHKEKQLLREYLDTVMFYINTTMDPVKAFDYAKQKKDNEYVSDICEKMNFIKKAVPTGETVSEVSYTLNGETKTVQLAGFRREAISISRDQLDSLNLTWVSGNTDVDISFRGDPGNLDNAYKEIGIAKTITNAKSDGAPSIIALEVKMPAGTPKGYYKLRDRIPSNMRFIGARSYDYSRKYWADNPEKQLVDIFFYYDGEASSVSLEYQAVKIGDSKAVAGQAYVSRAFRLDEAWGVSE